MLAKKKVNILSVLNTFYLTAGKISGDVKRIGYDVWGYSDQACFCWIVLNAFLLPFAFSAFLVWNNNCPDQWCVGTWTKLCIETEIPTSPTSQDLILSVPDFWILWTLQLMYLSAKSGNGWALECVFVQWLELESPPWVQTISKLGLIC